MRILLDSHTLVWFLGGDRKCSPRVRKIVEDPGSEVFVSAVSAWEMATKVRAGKWPEAAEFAREIDAYLVDYRFSGLPVSVEHGRVAGFLPGDHRDPFDRMLAAQAIVENLGLATADPAFRHFDVRVIW